MILLDGFCLNVLMYNHFYISTIIVFTVSLFLCTSESQHSQVALLSCLAHFSFSVSLRIALSFLHFHSLAIPLPLSLSLSLLTQLVQLDGIPLLNLDLFRDYCLLKGSFSMLL